MKKKRFLSILLSIMLILSMLPVSVLAEGTETADETPACICETLCTENQMNADCPVCGAEGADLTQCLGTSEGKTEPANSTVSANEIPVCTCETACTEGSINSDCPVCGAEGADLSQCLGKQTEPEMGEETADPTPEPTPEIMQEPTQEPTNESDASVVEVQGMIDALPDAESLTGLSLEDQQAVYTKMQAAFDACNALTDEQKAQITGAEIFDELFAVFNSMISAIPDEGEGVTLTGDGSSGNPYQIAEAADLKAFANKVNNGRETDAWAVLTADIVLNEGDLSGYNGTDTVSWEQWTPIGTSARRYTGTFDGNGHTVSGIYINNSSANYQGLFGCVGSGGTVQKVGVVNSYIQGGSYTGGVAGEVYNNGTVTNCYNTGTVSGSDYTGGVAGEVYNSTVTNSYNTGTVSGSSYTGGAAGYVVSSSTVTNSYSTGTVSGSRFYTGGVAGYVYNNSTVTNSYNTGTVNGNNINGGVAGYVDSGTVTNCYYLADTASAGIGSNSGTATPLTAEQMSGSAAKDNMTGFDFDTIWATRNESYTGQSTGSDENTVTVTTTSYAPYLQVFGEDSAPILSSTASEVEKMQQETGDDNKTYYLIYDKEDLELFRDIVNGTLTGVSAQIYEADSGANGRLMADIVLNEDFGQSKFALNEDGNVTYDGSTEIPFEQWTPIGSSSYSGTFDGDGHIVSGIYINNSSVFYQGLFGTVRNGTVRNLGVVNSYISGSGTVGGVAGYVNGGTIESCYNTGAVIGSSSYVGGIAGRVRNGGSITSCYNTSSVIGSSTYVGGITGYVDNGTIVSCYNTGMVSGSSRVGGVVGFNSGSGTVQNCYFLEGSASAGIGNGSSTATALTAIQMTGSAATTSMTGFDFNNTWVSGGEATNWQYNGIDGDDETLGIYTSAGYLPQLKVFIDAGNSDHETLTASITGLQQETDDGKIYYLIYDADELKTFRNIVNGTDLSDDEKLIYGEGGNASVNGRLEADIILKEDFDQSKFALDEDGNLTYDGSTEIPEFGHQDPIGTNARRYTGTFDGNGYTVSGIYINNSSANYQGLFGFVDEDERRKGPCGKQLYFR